MEKQQNQYTENIVSGRRSFDRQFDMLTISVHTLQRDFAALESRAAGTQKAVDEASESIDKLTEKLHEMDKILIAKIATITVTERMLWAFGTAMLGMIVHFVS